MATLDALLSPGSGPLWGFVGVVATVLAGWISARMKAKTDTTTAALAAVNVGQKQLVDGLFQQVKLLTERVTELQGHTDDCERRHREAMVRIVALEAQIAEKPLD